jgi:uncharacterized protein (TIGR03437 family)
VQYRQFFRAQASVVFILLALFLCLPVQAQVTLKLLGQLNPFPTSNRYGDVWGEGNFAYLASYNGNGVMIIDISNSASPRLVGHYNPASGGRFQDVVVIDGVGYFSSENNGGLHIVDVRNPANPVPLSQITPTQNGYPFVHEIAVADGVLYEADSRTNKVRAFDVRNPSNPVFIREIVTTDTRFIHAAVAVNGRLFTSGWGGKTDIYDVRNILTQAPPLLGVVDSGDNSHSSWVSNDGKILASARETLNGDVRLFDISNPSSPQLLSTITAQSLGFTAYSGHNPYIIGNLLFVSWYQAGLVVIDISNPTQPKLMGTYDTFAGDVNGFDGCWGVYPFLGLDRVLVSDLDGGLFIFDATNAIAGPTSVSAASYNVSAIASKSIVAAFGINLATQTLIATQTPLPTSLGGTTVIVQDSKGSERAASLFFVSPTQINYQIPAGTAAGPALLKISQTGGQTILGTTIVMTAAPSIFTNDQSGKGEAAALDGFTLTRGPFNATQPNGQPNIIAVFGDGFGEDGTDLVGNIAASIQASLDGQQLIVEYAGQAPGFVGLNQLNIVLPVGISAGAHSLIITRGGVSSNPVSITVK